MSILRDVVTFGGLTAVFVGLWWERPAAALVVVGGVLFWTGYRSVRGK